MKNGFFFYENFKTTADSLPDEMRLKFYDALTNYAINGVEPEDDILKALITAFKPSINKIEKRGGNNNPTGQNQYTKVKSGQKEVKDGQSGQSFNKQETGNIKQETGNIKEKINKKEKLNLYGEFKHVHLTEEYYEHLKSTFGEEKLSRAIEKLDGWLDNPKQKSKRNCNHRFYFKSGGWVWEVDKVPKSGGIGEWDKTPETYTVGDY